jgi:hypothetical protein
VLSTTTHDGRAAAGARSLVDLVRFGRLRNTPRWVSVALLSAFLCAVMPSVHLRVFGQDRVADATLDLVSSTLRAQIGSDGAARLRSALMDRDPVVGAVVAFSSMLVQILLMGFVMNATTALCDARITPSRVLSVVAVTNLFMLAFRVLLFAFVTFALGVDQAVAPEWTRVALMSLDLSQASGPVLRTFLAAVDVVTIVGIAVAAWGLKVMAPGLGTLSLLFCASSWWLLATVLRLALSSLLNLPLV